MDFLAIESGAHEAATSPYNQRNPPTEAQAKAGNYKMGRIRLHGLDIAIENPRGTYRSGRNPDTGLKWTSRLAAHYGYFPGTMGNDGDPVDCFVGEWVYSDKIYVVNQFFGEKFDEHKVMIGFYDEEAAKIAYQHSFNHGWSCLKSITPCTITQFRWWLENGNMKKPLYHDHLPHEGTNTMQMIYWTPDANPANIEIGRLLYNMRKDSTPEQGDLIMDAATLADVEAEMAEWADEVITLDAIVVEYKDLTKRLQVMKKAMNRVGELQVMGFDASKPVTKAGATHIAAVFSLSDGQTLSIYFHNPDTTPTKIALTDELISWKNLLNKKDVTIAVAPESGKVMAEVDVAKRMMKLAEKNSAAFQRQSERNAGKAANIEALNTEIAGLEKELSSKQKRLEAAKIAATAAPKQEPIKEEPIEAGTDTQTPAPNAAATNDKGTSKRTDSAIIKAVIANLEAEGFVKDGQDTYIKNGIAVIANNAASQRKASVFLLSKQNPSGSWQVNVGRSSDFGGYADKSFKADDIWKQIQAEIARLSTPEQEAPPVAAQSPNFIPTHELPDGTPVTAHPDEPGVWVDAEGDEHETDNVSPIGGIDFGEKVEQAEEATFTKDAIYKTKSGKVAMQVKITNKSYKYMGEYGAGSGGISGDYEKVIDDIRSNFKGKRGFYLESGEDVLGVIKDVVAPEPKIEPQPIDVQTTTNDTEISKSQKMDTTTSAVIAAIESQKHKVETQEIGADGNTYIETDNRYGDYAEVVVYKDGALNVAFGKGKIVDAIKAVNKNQEATPMPEATNEPEITEDPKPETDPYTSRIEALRTMPRSEYDDAIDALIEELEAAGVMDRYEDVLNEIDTSRTHELQDMVAKATGGKTLDSATSPTSADLMEMMQSLGQSQAEAVKQYIDKAISDLVTGR